MIAAWLKAARPLAHANIGVPLLFGQALAYALTGAFEIRVLLALALWGVFDHLFIVFANDIADVEADTFNTAPTILSGGSRVLVDGDLSAAHLARGAQFAAFGMLAVSLWLAHIGRPHGLVATAGALALLAFYSFKPLRLSYRGHGEILQGVGVGVVLPWLGYCAQTGTSLGYPIAIGLGGYLLGAAGNIITALPDLEADELVDKRTVPVRFGATPSRVMVSVMTAASVWLFAYALAPSTSRDIALGVTLGSSVGLLGLGAYLHRRERPDRLMFPVLAGAAGLSVWALFGWALVA